MKACMLASGSKGNCLFFSSGKTNILVDCGLSLTDALARLKKIDISPSSINAILLTHEHSDHTKGVGMLANRYNIPVYFLAENFDRLNRACKFVRTDLQRFFYVQTFTVGDVTVEPFLLPHDSFKNCGYSFIVNNKKVSIATDLGYVSSDTLNCLKHSVLVFLEANHDETMLMKNPKYTASLKRRILSQVGHLSNLDCGKCAVALAQNSTKQIVLCHLSEENNSPELAYNTVKEVLSQHDIIEGVHIAVDVATQNQVSTCFSVL